MAMVALLYPELLGTYGDGGNALVLAKRAAWRGLELQVTEVTGGEPLPDADLFLLGGGEDGPQVRATSLLRSDGGLTRAVERGATIFAVCAGLQILGHQFAGSNGEAVEGLSLLDVVTERSNEPRAVGEVLATATAPGFTQLGVLTGFENHGGRTTLGPAASPLGAVTHGVGNCGDGTEGAIQGSVIATYLHGPVLARNPALADLLLERIFESALAPLDDQPIDALRRDRLALRP